MKFSLIAPTYGRPDEVSEFVRSATALAFDPTAFEIILSDGTPRDALRPLVEALQKETSVAVRFLHEEGLPVSEARNWAAKQANGTILLFLDSDCLLPSTYLTQIEKGLQAADWDAFGGPDDAPSDFSPLQKAISFSMTSLWTALTFGCSIEESVALLAARTRSHEPSRCQSILPVILLDARSSPAARARRNRSAQWHQRQRTSLISANVVGDNAVAATCRCHVEH